MVEFSHPILELAEACRMLKSFLGGRIIHRIGRRADGDDDCGECDIVVDECDRAEINGYCGRG